jgi:hypothetical protein
MKNSCLNDILYFSSKLKRKEKRRKDIVNKPYKKKNKKKNVKRQLILG